MSRTLELPEPLIESIEQRARDSGQTVQSWVEALVREQDDRDEAFENVARIKQRMSLKYGRQPDSVPLIREDRDR